MSRVWNRHTLLLAAVTLAASLCVGATAPGVAQEEGRPAARDVPPRKVIRTQRLRVPADLFKQDAVSFKRARVDASGTIRAGGACRGCNRGKLCRSRGVGTTHQGWHLGRRSAIAPRR